MYSKPQPTQNSSQKLDLISRKEIRSLFSFHLSIAFESESWSKPNVVCQPATAWALMSCHAFQGCPCVLNYSIWLTCYLGLQIKNAQLLYHSAYFWSLNISILCCLYLTTFWKFPNKTCRNQTISGRMSNHMAETRIRQRYCLWLFFFWESMLHSRVRMDDQ